MKPRISIIITNFNYLKFLPDCINSIQPQKPDELIIVDDGSTDGSSAWLKECESYATVIRKVNGGQASAMNAGYKVSTGDLVWFIDADDILLPGAIDAARARMESGLSKIHIRCQVINEYRHSRRFLPRKWQPLPFGDLTKIYGYLGYYPSVPTSGNVYTRSFLEELGPISEASYRICADAYLHDWAPLKGRIAAIPTPLIGYRIHRSNNFAGRRKMRGAEWIAEKTQRLSNKWLAVSSLGLRPRWLVEMLFMLSPDYLQTLSQLAASHGNKPIDLGRSLPRPKQALELIVSFLSVPVVFRVYSRVWLVLAWTCYTVARF